MKTALLVISPQAEFGTSILKELGDSEFNIFVTKDFSGAIRFVHENDCRLVMLDAELEDVALSVLDIGYALRQIKPEIQFIIVIHTGQDVDSASLTPAATLIKPISMKDLSILLQKLVNSNRDQTSFGTPASQAISNHPDENESPKLIWLKDVSKAAQQLTQITLESSAQAAFIIRKNELWAYAGQLSREAAQELTDSIEQTWNHEEESDLLRFVRLKATGAQHMLYARKLSGDMSLALVFDAETPFSTIRLQTGKLVKDLYKNDMVQVDLPQKSNFSHAEPENEPADNTEFPDFPPIADLLGEIPLPIPSKNPTPPLAKTEIVNFPGSKPEIERIDSTRFNRAPEEYLKSIPDIQTQADTNSEIQPGFGQQKASTPGNQNSGEPSLKNKNGYEKTNQKPDQDLASTRKSEINNDPQSVIETRVHFVSGNTPDSAHRILIESPSVFSINLAYACLLIPRFEHHHLIGDVSTHLNEWVQQISVAYGWRLEYLAIRPDYLQWITRVPVNTAAGYVINTIRKHTSERMFNEFPRFMIDNPSGEFWARGFIVQGGSQPHPQKLIKDFIKQTRVRQGLRM